jgi:hypothetical protein
LASQVPRITGMSHQYPEIIEILSFLHSHLSSEDENPDYTFLVRIYWEKLYIFKVWCKYWLH